jgi:hypothetical protein
MLQVSILSIMSLKDTWYASKARVFQSRVDELLSAIELQPSVSDTQSASAIDFDREDINGGDPDFSLLVRACIGREDSLEHLDLSVANVLAMMPATHRATDAFRIIERTPENEELSILDIQRWTKRMLCVVLPMMLCKSTSVVLHAADMTAKLARISCVQAIDALPIILYRISIVSTSRFGFQFAHMLVLRIANRCPKNTDLRLFTCDSVER